LGARKRSLPFQKEKREKEKKADIKYSTKIYCNLRCQQGKDESPVQIGWLLRIATGQPEPAICSPEPISYVAPIRDTDTPIRIRRYGDTASSKNKDTAIRRVYIEAEK